MENITEVYPDTLTVQTVSKQVIIITVYSGCNTHQGEETLNNWNARLFGCQINVFFNPPIPKIDIFTRGTANPENSTAVTHSDKSRYFTNERN